MNKPTLATNEELHKALRHIVLSFYLLNILWLTILSV